MAADHQGQQWDRLGRTLGTTVDLRELVGMADKRKDGEAKEEPVQLQTTVNIPFLLASAPDFFSHLAEEYKKKYGSMLASMREAGGTPVVELGTLDSKQARDFYRQVGAMIASASPPTPDEDP